MGLAFDILLTRVLSAIWEIRGLEKKHTCRKETVLLLRDGSVSAKV